MGNMNVGFNPSGDVKDNNVRSIRENGIGLMVANSNEQNVVMASVDTIDLENFNKSLFKEVNNINQDNFDQEYISPKKIKLFTKNKQLNVENAEHFTFSKKDVKELKRSQSSKGKLKRDRSISNNNSKEVKTENKRSRSKTPVAKKDNSISKL